MAKSKCVKCENETFELAEIQPTNSEKKIILLQCASCGAVAGSLDQYDVGFFVKEIAKKLGVTIKE